MCLPAKHPVALRHENAVMKRTLQDCRILLTGASSGIGRALAEQLGSAGARVALAARSTDKLEELASQLTARNMDVLAVPADVTREEDRQRLLDTAVSRLGGLDVLINNAGVGSWAHFADSTEEILRQVLEVNFFAPVELIRLAIPVLTQGRQPAVLNVASMCGRRGMPAWSEYSASKFALCGMTEALRGELARFDIDVLLVLPGLTRSGLQTHLLKNTGRAKIDFANAMAPEEVAAGIVKALQRNRAETVLGRDARWMLRVNRFFPRLVDWLIARNIKKLYASDVSSRAS
jgi:short-subunit dehydrogenase